MYLKEEDNIKRKTFTRVVGLFLDAHYSETMLECFVQITSSGFRRFGVAQLLFVENHCVLEMGHFLGRS